MLECEKANKFPLTKENSKKEWQGITKIYRQNKKNRGSSNSSIELKNIIKGSIKNNKVRKRRQEIER